MLKVAKYHHVIPRQVRRQSVHMALGYPLAVKIRTLPFHRIKNTTNTIVRIHQYATPL
jgi:hypothetical protein